MRIQDKLDYIDSKTRQYGKLTDPPILYREVEEDDYRWLTQKTKEMQDYLDIIGKHVNKATELKKELEKSTIALQYLNEVASLAILEDERVCPRLIVNNTDKALEEIDNE